MFRTLAAVLIFAAAASAGAQAPADAAKPVDLGPKWTKGQTATFRLTQSQTIVQSMDLVGAPPDVQAPPPNESGLDLDATLTWIVTDADSSGGASGGGTATLSFDKLAMTMTSQGESVTVTADKAPEGTEGVRDWIAAMSGKTITYTIDAAGHVTQVDGWKAIKTALGDAGDDMDEAYFKEIAEDLALLTGGGADRSVGDTWNESHDSDHRLGAVRYDSTYEVQSVAPVAGIGVAVIARTAKLKFTPDLGDLPPDAPQPKVELTDSGQTAQLIFDLSRHELVGSNTDQVLEVTTTASRGPLTVKVVYRELTNTQILRTSEK